MASSSLKIEIAEFILECAVGWMCLQENGLRRRRMRLELDF